jgi:hypothetical protein
MIYAPLTKPSQLLAVLPHLLDTPEEAEEFWKYLNEGLDPACDLFLDDFSEEHAKAYTSIREAFEDIYPDDIDELMDEICCDYKLSFVDLPDLCENWLFEKHTCCWICDKLIVQHS